MEELQVALVSDNQEKFMTYKELMKRHKSAMKQEFYFEAMFIVYAMMEDRLTTYLYYIGCIKDRNTFCFDNPKVSDILKKLAKKYLDKKEKRLSVNTISGKRNIIRATLLWAENGFEDCEGDYLEVLRKVYQKKTDPTLFMEMLTQAENWCEYRNELVHGMMNKNISSLYETLHTKADEGLEIVRYFDKTVQKLKYKNEIRTSLGLTD